MLSCFPLHSSFSNNLLCCCILRTALLRSVPIRSLMQRYDLNMSLTSQWKPPPKFRSATLDLGKGERVKWLLFLFIFKALFGACFFQALTGIFHNFRIFWVTTTCVFEDLKQIYVCHIFFLIVIHDILKLDLADAFVISRFMLASFSLLRNIFEVIVTCTIWF